MARNTIQKDEMDTEIIAPVNEKISTGIRTTVVREENIRIMAYSLKKISTKPTEPYSILNPETSSDSPSAKSKGVRLVSATAIIIQSPATNIKHRPFLEKDSEL